MSHARVKVAVEKPLLGPYMFVELPLPSTVAIAAVVDGLSGFLVNAFGVAVAVPDEVVFSFRERYMRGEFDVTMRAIPIGAIVRVLEGEFADLIARVTEVKRGRVTINVRGTLRTSTMRQTNVVAAEERAPEKRTSGLGNAMVDKSGN